MHVYNDTAEAVEPQLQAAQNHLDIFADRSISSKSPFQRMQKNMARYKSQLMSKQASTILARSRVPAEDPSRARPHPYEVKARLLRLDENARLKSKHL